MNIWWESRKEKISWSFSAKHDLDILIIGSVCTDGAHVMLEHKSRFFALMKQEIPHLQGIHCFLHRHALATKTLSLSLKNVLNICVKTINWIRGCVVNHRPALSRFWKREFSFAFPRRSLLAFTWESFNTLLRIARRSKSFAKSTWLWSFQRNEINRILLNASLVERHFQPRERTECFYTREKYKHIKLLWKLNAFEEKLHIWCQLVTRGNLSNFLSLEETVDEDVSLIPSECEEIVNHLET